MVSPIVPPILAPIPPGYKGAYAEEIAMSRIGLQSGMLGAQNVTRTWRVYCNASTDNPIAVMEGLPSRYGGVQVGARFPTTGGWGDGTFVLQYFTIVDHWMGTRVWTIQGNYVPSYVGQLLTPAWSFRIQSSLQTHKVYADLNEKGIGAPKYNAINPTTETPIATATNAFAKKSADATIYLALAGGGSDPFAENLPRYLVGADVPLRTSTVTFWKTIPSYLQKAAAIHAALNAKRNINSDAVQVLTTSSSGKITFVNDSDGIGKMLMRDIVLDPIENSASGGVPSFRVTIAMEYNPDGWQHHLTHTYKFDDGVEAPIRDGGGGFVSEEFKINGETSLSAIMGAFS
jgi:hypothetical protein